MEEVLTSQCMEPSKSPLQLLEGPWGFPFDPPPLILLRGKLPHGGTGLLQGQPADTLSSFSCSAWQCPHGTESNTNVFGVCKVLSLTVQHIYVILGLMIDQDSTPQHEQTPGSLFAGTSFSLVSNTLAHILCHCYWKPRSKSLFSVNT